MAIYDTFVLRAITAFLVPVILSGVCYFLVSATARVHSPTPREIYIRRLILMLILVVVWWVCYPIFGVSAFIGNSADPRNAAREALWMAKQLGTSYGIHAIWAWCAVALVDWPKMRPNTALEPTATAPSVST